MTLRLSIGVEKYSGNLIASDGGQGGGKNVTVSFNKSLVSFNAFPINMYPIKSLSINLGVQYSRLIAEDFSGRIDSWNIYGPGYSENLENKYNEYSAQSYLGICVRVAYDIRLGQAIGIVPQYKAYIGLSPEFIEFPNSTKSFRQYLSIGIRINLKNDT